MTVHVLWEVKVRENQYDFIKDVSARIEGLLPTVQLATRERRLLWHGDLIWHSESSAAAQNKRKPSSRPTAIFSPEFTHGRNLAGSHRTPTIVLSPCPDDIEQTMKRQRSSTADDTAGPRNFPVHVFVFTDVVVIAKTLPKTRSNGIQWSLLPEAGTARLLGVSSVTQEAGVYSLISN